MKKLILFFAVLATISASAQTDTSRQLIRITWKVKHCLFMAGMIASANTIADSRLKDSLTFAVGSATQFDSATTISMHAGTVLRFIQNVAAQQGGQIYDFLNEIQTSTAAQGWRGLTVQLNAKISAGGAEGKTAQWLKTQIAAVLAPSIATQNSIYSTAQTFLFSIIPDN